MKALKGIAKIAGIAIGLFVLLGIVIAIFQPSGGERQLYSDYGAIERDFSEHMKRKGVEITEFPDLYQLQIDSIISGPKAGGRWYRGEAYTENGVVKFSYNFYTDSNDVYTFDGGPIN